MPRFFKTNYFINLKTVLAMKKFVKNSNLFFAFAGLFLLSVVLAPPAAAPAEKEPYVIGVIEGGQAKFTRKEALLKALRQHYDGEFRVLDARIDRVRNDARLLVSLQDKTGQNGELGFTLQVQGRNLNATPIPGQTCTGKPCSKCAFQEGGWGCACLDGSEKGKCNHTATSVSLDKILEIQTN
jgi:hypothetical protein